jgi:hypothetical protein
MGLEVCTSGRSEEGEYDGNIMYWCMKMEKWDLLKHSRNGGRR